MVAQFSTIRNESEVFDFVFSNFYELVTYRIRELFKSEETSSQIQILDLNHPSQLYSDEIEVTATSLYSVISRICRNFPEKEILIKIKYPQGYSGVIALKHNPKSYDSYDPRIIVRYGLIPRHETMDRKAPLYLFRDDETLLSAWEEMAYAQKEVIKSFQSGDTSAQYWRSMLRDISAYRLIENFCYERALKRFSSLPDGTLVKVYLTGLIPASIGVIRAYQKIVQEEGRSLGLSLAGYTASDDKYSQIVLFHPEGLI